MRQNDLALEAAKKTAKTAANRDVVEPWGHVNPSQLMPGEKSKITVDLARGMLTDVQDQIRKLQQVLAQTQDLEKQQEAMQVQGLLDNLNTLKDNLTAKIQELDTIPPSLLNLFERIEQDCSEFLQAAKQTNKWLYRGSLGSTAAYVGKSWDNRRPRDSSQQTQKIFDSLLAQLGFVALRSNSIFATADINSAIKFGEVFLIFPIDNHSNFTYTKYKDLVIKPESLPFDQEKVDVWKMPILEILQNKLAEMRKESQHTVMLDRWVGIFKHGKAGMIINVVLNFNKELKSLGVPINLLDIKYQELVDLKKFRTKYQPKNTNLAAALNDKVEIYIHGSYYALKADDYQKYANKYFGINP